MGCGGQMVSAPCLIETARPMAPMRSKAAKTGAATTATAPARTTSARSLGSRTFSIRGARGAPPPSVTLNSFQGAARRPFGRRIWDRRIRATPGASGANTKEKARRRKACPERRRTGATLRPLFLRCPFASSCLLSKKSRTYVRRGNPRDARSPTAGRLQPDAETSSA